MRCASCGAELEGAFPGAVVECACGAKTSLPYEHGSAPRGGGPYRASQATATAARRVTCPFCGDEIHPGARECPTCRVNLDLARCRRCRRLSRFGERTCAACGEELPRAAPGDATDAPCPRCHGTLHPLADDEGLEADALDTCAACGGVFLGHETLARAAERYAKGGPLPVVFLEHVEPVSDPVVYLRCPCCGTLMSRKRMAKMVVDVCRLHGTWFDRGELARALPRAPDPTESEPAAEPAPGREAVAHAQVEVATDSVRVKQQASFVRAFLGAVLGLGVDV